MNLESKKRLVLIDAHAILHRAYHALPEFNSSKGEPTGALYGLSTMLIKIITDLRPDYIAAAYDLPKPTFRHEAYKEYKMGRAKADDALISQMKRSREIFEAFHIPIYDKEGFEADDILGTIVHELIANRKTQNANLEIIIASGDMDTLQLVRGKQVRVFTLRKGIADTVMYDEEAVTKRYGFGPELLPDFKGLKGDPSDNIKGVKGIGDKTAAELILKFGTVEKIYRELEKGKDAFIKKGVRLRVAELLEKGKEDAEFSKVLGTIRTDAPIKFSLPKEYWCEGIDLDKAEKLFTALEFRALGSRLKEAVAKIKGGGETGGTAEETGGKKGGGEKLPEKSAQASLAEAFESRGISKQDLAETSVALWLINSNLTSPELSDILAYGQTEDFRIARAKIFAELEARKLTGVFNTIEKPLIPIVEKMNEKGIKVDVGYLRLLSKEYRKELVLRERKIFELAGREFNINSPKQLGEALFVEMGLKVPRQKKTSTGAFSTRESELEKLKDAHPIIAEILAYREFQKLLSTYIDNIPAMIGKDGRLHARFLSAGTTTGRMSSQNPNLQNIPVQSELGRRIRNAFVSERGFKLLSFDYSQIELRIAAILSRDTKLMDIFRRGEDVHSAVASEVFNVPKESVSKDMRRQAKVINFGILYGMGVNSLRSALSEGGSAISKDEAQKFYNEYFSDFHELAGYLEKVKTSAGELGFTETLFGRRRYHEAIHSHIPYIKASAERTAINAPIQGTAADIIKLAMVRAEELLKAERLDDKVFLLLQIHDELVYEAKDGVAESAGRLIRKAMENVLSEKQSEGVPILVESYSGSNWGEMKKIE